MANIAGAGGSTHGDENAATQYLIGQGIQNPSSGLVRYVASGAQNYGYNEATQYGLPISADMLKQQRDAAIAPAIESYKAEIPEIAQTYSNRNSQLEGSKQPLIDKYQNLLADITGKLSTQNAQEFGKRGIPISSGVVGQALNQKVLPYEKDINLSQSNDLRDIGNQQTNLVSQQTADQRAIYNAIANLQAGAGNSSVADALNLYANQQANQFTGRFDDLQKQLLQQQIANGGSNGSNIQIVKSGSSLYSVDKSTGAVKLLQGSAGGMPSGSSNPAGV